MEVELWARLDADPHARGAHRAALYARLLQSARQTFQMDDPDVLTDEVMLHLAFVAHKSMFPIFRAEVDAEVEKMCDDPVVRRAYHYLSTALLAFANGHLARVELANRTDWIAWMDTL